MNTKQTVNAAILIAAGTILHYLIPGFIGGVKPDFMLACVFVIIMITPNTKTALTVAVVSGILTALTTNFPGGQIPSIVDKFISCFAVLLLAKVFPLHSEGKLSLISKVLVFFLGTLISGVVFLGSASLMVGLPGGASLGAMIMAIVVPTAIANIFFGLLVDRVVATYKSKLARA